MKPRSIKLKVSAAIGSVTAEVITPKNAFCALIFAHGAGAGMNHVFMTTLSGLLAEAGIATMRFNFPFMENKKGRPDTPAVAHQTIEAAIKKAQKQFKGLPVFAAGKSFGGRMTSQYVSANPDATISGIIFYGFPLHAPGKPSIDRAEHLKLIKTPMLFLQGTRDELADWKLIQKVCKPLKSATVVKIEGANHAFKAGKQNILQLLADETKAWTEKLVNG